MTENGAQVREQLSLYARKIVDQGLVVGPGGNMSARVGEQMLVSPSGFAFADIAPEQWVAVNIESGAVAEDAPFRPSSEVLLHLFSYRADDKIQAIIHTHPAHIIALTLVRDDLPIMFPDQAALVGKVGFVPYVLPTTDLLANKVASRIPKYNSLLLGNHGLVTVGHNLREAYYRTEVCEESAKIYLLAHAVCKPKLLTEEEFEAVAALESEAYRIQLLQQLE